MTNHRMFNTALFVLALIAWLFVMGDDYEHADLAMQERREWVHAVQYCHRTAGPQTAPEYDERGTLICVGRKGQRHNEVRLAKQ